MVIISPSQYWTVNLYEEDLWHAIPIIIIRHNINIVATSKLVAYKKAQQYRIFPKTVNGLDSPEIEYNNFFILYTKNANIHVQFIVVVNQPAVAIYQ